MHIRSIKALSIAGAAVLCAAAPQTGSAYGSQAGFLAVRDAANAYRHQERGCEVFRVDTTTQINAGPIHRQDANATVYLVVEGSFYKKRVLMMVENKHRLDDRELAEKSAEPDGPISRRGLRLPYDLAALGDYTYDPPLAQGTGSVVRFRATVRDEAHGDGQIAIDAGGNVDDVEFSPAVLPHGASTGTITVHFGDVGGSRRDITEIDRVFSGRRFFITGRAVSTSRYTQYRSYPDVAAAMTAISEFRA